MMRSKSSSLLNGILIFPFPLDEHDNWTFEPKNPRKCFCNMVYSSESLLLVRGKVSEPKTTIHKGNITIIPSISDAELVSAVAEAQKIIARSGYSTIMDFEALGVLHKAELHPTPGQSEQEYLAEWLKK